MADSVDLILGHSVVIENVRMAACTVNATVGVEPPGHGGDHHAANEGTSEPEAGHGTVHAEGEGADNGAGLLVVKE